ncbi:hypothetical protein PCCS19_01430 [Paenibacillus sp. CCS19]|uniref:hypothetical protein n=1 Tax=Paenibacillus sp. CCS19 TaxID=3158387 RepID=UPI0025672C32|nr:hypothetical protein [Paenibacillus cellulosilyticus]GMK37090.1 hypothetical protein PCCS19_01430 [Paenibacillus cellulosilyticus]
MKRIVLLVLLIMTLLLHPTTVHADPTMPCSLVLEPTNPADTNAKGAALMYKVKLTPSFPRTHISIHASHLPAPASFGDYDRYEGFAFIPDVISWRFKLYPTPEQDPDWVGRIDTITADLNNSQIQVRLTNSTTDRLGPAVLTGTITNCK